MKKQKIEHRLRDLEERVDKLEHPVIHVPIRVEKGVMEHWWDDLKKSLKG
jgi:hypothetical protein